MTKTTKRRAAARAHTGSAKDSARVAAVHRDSQGRFTSLQSAPRASASALLNRAGRRQAAKASRTAGRQMGTPSARQTVPAAGRAS